eukprot:g778.t1
MSSFFGWGSKGLRDDSVREQDLLGHSFSDQDVLPTSIFTQSKRPPQFLESSKAYFPTNYAYVHQTNPYGGYYRSTPQFFGRSSMTHGTNSLLHLSQSQPSRQMQENWNQLSTKPTNSNLQSVGAVSAHPSPYYNQLPDAYVAYGYNPYPYSYNHGDYSAPLASCPIGAEGDQFEDSDDDEEEEDDEEETGTKFGLMTVEGKRPLFLVALFVVSIAVLMIIFPLTLLSAGYMGPLGMVYSTGLFSTAFAFWAIYLTPCECYPNVDWATSRIRTFATSAAVMSAMGAVGIPVSLYGTYCPEDDFAFPLCEDTLPVAKGISIAAAVVLGTQCFLCLLVRSNARKLAESKFSDQRTEAIVLAPKPSGIK